MTHEAETLLDIFRKGRAKVEPRHVDLLCRASDFIRKLLDRVEQQLTDAGFEDTAAAIILDLQETINAVCGAGQAGGEDRTPNWERLTENPLTDEETTRGAGEGSDVGGRMKRMSLSLLIRQC